jgi:hypothetical protein
MPTTRALADTTQKRSVCEPRSLAALATMLLFMAGALPAAEVPSITQDLTSVIALLGLPCGKVVSSRRQAENDYLATCQDGNRYRVFDNSEGRVVAQKQ